MVFSILAHLNLRGSPTAHVWMPLPTTAEATRAKDVFDAALPQSGVNPMLAVAPLGRMTPP